MLHTHSTELEPQTVWESLERSKSFATACIVSASVALGNPQVALAAAPAPGETTFNISCAGEQINPLCCVNFPPNRVPSIVHNFLPPELVYIALIAHSTSVVQVCTLSPSIVYNLLLILVMYTARGALHGGHLIEAAVMF